MATLKTTIDPNTGLPKISPAPSPAPSPSASTASKTTTANQREDRVSNPGTGITTTPKPAATPKPAPAKPAPAKPTPSTPGANPEPPASEGSGTAIPKTPTAEEILAANKAYLAQLNSQNQAATNLANRQSAYDLLFQQFNQYGLGSLVEPLKALVQQDVSPSEFTIRLQDTEAYKKRFAANADRIAKGLSALSPAEYIALEDQYQNVMRNYGLPDTYYAKDSMGTQAGFQKLLAGDVSATELEDRISTAQNRVVNANPEVKQALRQFYPDITDGDILAYALDPQKALTDIKRKVTAAEIGGAALGQGLSASQLGAEGLAAAGVTKQQAQQGYGTIGEFLPTAQKLASIYQEQPYTQQQAESEIFNLANSAEAAKRRKKLSQLEQASFSGSSGVSSGALNRDRALNNQGYGSGAY